MGPMEPIVPIDPIVPIGPMLPIVLIVPIDPIGAMLVLVSCMRDIPIPRPMPIMSRECWNTPCWLLQFTGKTTRVPLVTLGFGPVKNMSLAKNVRESSYFVLKNVILIDFLTKAENNTDHVLLFVVGPVETNSKEEVLASPKNRVRKNVVVHQVILFSVMVFGVVPRVEFSELHLEWLLRIIALRNHLHSILTTATFVLVGHLANQVMRVLRVRAVPHRILHTMKRTGAMRAARTVLSCRPSTLHRPTTSLSRTLAEARDVIVGRQPRNIVRRHSTNRHLLLPHAAQRAHARCQSSYSAQAHSSHTGRHA